MRIRYGVCFLLGSLIPVQDNGCQKSQTPLVADTGPSSKTADARLNANHLHEGRHDFNDDGERSDVDDP
jgi:hypothetical protein